MKVLVLGSSGIIGQHLILTIPNNVSATFHKHKSVPFIWESGDITDNQILERLLAEAVPDVVINLAGENRVDAVEKDPERYRSINVELPTKLAEYCHVDGSTYIHISTNGLFNIVENGMMIKPITGGFESNDLAFNPVNEYGKQKAEAEFNVLKHGSSIIVRATFIVGIQKIKLGRKTPIEQMLNSPSGQVFDRKFSILDAWDCARYLWKIVLNHSKIRGKRFHFSSCGQVSRFDIDYILHGANSKPVSHYSFKGIAERPINTSYNQEMSYTPKRILKDVVNNARKEYIIMEDFWSMEHRLNVLATFFKNNVDWAREQITPPTEKFQKWHKEIANEFRTRSPKGNEELLAWYKETYLYIFELSAYHLDLRFDCFKMYEAFGKFCLNPIRKNVLCLGDGIGDLTCYLRSKNIQAYYNDIEGSQTAKFAGLNYWLRLQSSLPSVLSKSFSPPETSVSFDTIIGLDFFEHLPNVEEWVSWCFKRLNSKGRLMAKNSFPGANDESIPMHLACNSKYLKTWKELCTKVGFKSLEKSGEDISKE